jgi:hypothetical protein
MTRAVAVSSRSDVHCRSDEFLVDKSGVDGQSRTASARFAGRRTIRKKRAAWTT